METLTKAIVTSEGQRPAAIHTPISAKKTSFPHSGKDIPFNHEATMRFYPRLKTLLLLSIVVMLLAACGDFSAKDAMSNSEEGKEALALISKGLDLAEQGKLDAAIAAYDEVDRRFGKDNTPKVREYVAMALIIKGLSLGRQGKPDAAIAAYDEIERRFGGDNTPEMREIVAKALFDRGLSLEEQGKFDAAIAVYDEVERRFGRDNTPEVRKLVSDARRSRDILRNQAGNE
jgi:tetratricopeptide (TPR) repeat protein